MFALFLAAAIGAPQQGELKTFHDWVVGCDNVRACQANALMPEDAGDDDYLMLLVERDGGPGQPARLLVPLPGKTAPGTRFTLAVDGKPVAALVAGRDDQATLVATRATIDALLGGTRVSLLDAHGKGQSSASLAGLSASLIYIDDRQQRVGTTGALKARGMRPDTAPAPLPPVIAVPPPSPRPPHTISTALAAKLIGPDNATCDYAVGKVEPQASRLDATHSLVVVDHPCGNGAYNMFSSVYIVDEAGTPHPAAFDVDPGMGEPGDDDLTNGGWDAKTRRLGSYAKGRGLGDCGTMAEYAWDGTRFRLTEATMMSECRGSTDYIRTWTARTAP